MASASSRGEVALIEAVSRAAARVPATHAAVLQRATLVLAQEAAHPNLLSHVPEGAQLGVWDPQLAIAQAQAGARVVGLVASFDEVHLRASGVVVQELRAAPAIAGPLAGLRVLTTRPRAAAHVQRDRFAALGADAVALPCLELQGPEDPAAFDRLVERVELYDGVILSSRAGVDALEKSLGRLGRDSESLGARLVVAVGGATAQACAAAGIVPDIVPEQARSEGIARALTERSLLGGRWIHVRARDGRDTLDEAISGAGGTYELAVGYRTERPSPPRGVTAWVGAGVDAICLHSGRTGQHLHEMLEDMLPGSWAELVAGAAVISAGPVTTKALQEQGFEVAATAASPGDDGMLQAVVELLGSAPRD